MNQKETIQLIEKLIELTQDNVITWKISNDYPNLSSMENYDTIFSAEHLNQNLRVYKYFYRHYFDEDAYHTLESYRLETFDDDNNTLYRFIETTNTSDLLSAVMYQKSNIADFYKQIIT